MEGLGPIATIDAFLHSREQAIWRAFAEMPETPDFHAVADFLQQITYLVHTALRGILHLFVINGAVFFSDDSFAALKRKSPRSLFTPNQPLFSLKSNWSEIGLFWTEACADVMDFCALDAPPRRNGGPQVTLADINLAAEAWFGSLCHAMQPKLNSIFSKLNTTSLVSQLHHFLGKLLEELHDPSLVDTEVIGLSV